MAARRHELRWASRTTMLDQLNTGWCTPGVHAPGEREAYRRQRDTDFTLRTTFPPDRAWSSSGSTPPSRSGVTGWCPRGSSLLLTSGVAVSRTGAHEVRTESRRAGRVGQHGSRNLRLVRNQSAEGLVRAPQVQRSSTSRALCYCRSAARFVINVEGSSRLVSTVDPSPGTTKPGSTDESEDHVGLSVP